MAEDIARAVGASGPDCFIINGKECYIRPLKLRELGEIERECLQGYKNQYLQTYKDNIHLLDGDPDELMDRKVDEIARWDVADLPSQFIYDPRRVVVTDKLKEWAIQNLDIDIKQGEKDATVGVLASRIQAHVVNALDSKILDEASYQDMVGEKPKKFKTNYVSWWITGTFDGMLSLVHKSFKNNGVTRQEIEDEIGMDTALLSFLARSVESVTAPEAGNG